MDILIKPVITEKMTSITEKFNKYGFIVDRRANKIEIKKAVEEMYNVEVDCVNTMNYLGKRKTLPHSTPAPDNPRQTSSYNPSASETTNAESLPSAT